MAKATMNINIKVFLNNNPIQPHSLKTKLGFYFLRLARKCLVIDMNTEIKDCTMPPDVFIATEDDGSQWVMLKDYKKLLEVSNAGN